MHTIKLMAAGLVAAFAMAVSAQAASASYLVAPSPAGGFTLISNGSLTFSTGFLGDVRCPMTLEGLLNVGPVELVASTQLGEIVEATVGRCSIGSASMPMDPDGWQFTLTAAPSGLPDSATELQTTIDGLRFVWSITLATRLTCLYQGTFGVPLSLTDTGTNTYDTATSVALTTATLAKSSGAAMCPTRLGFSGSFTLDPAQSLTVF